MLSIQTNTSSLFGQRMVSRQETALGRALERVSSGLRVNSARDDAAGLAIANRMNAQSRGLRQGMRNSADAVSLMQTAEASLDSITGNLQRVRELGVQAANGPTLTDADKRSLQAEASQLLAEIGRTLETTRFNGQRIFDDPPAPVDTARRAVVDGLRDYWLADAERRISDFYGIRGDGAEMEVKIVQGSKGGVLASVSGTGGAGGKLENLKLTVELADFTPPNFPDGGTEPFFNDRIIAHEMVHAVMGRSVNLTGLPTWFSEGAAELIHGADERVANDLAVKTAANAGDAVAGANDLVDEIAGAWSGSSEQYSAGYLAVRYLHEQIVTEGGNGISDVMGYLASNGGSTLDTALANVATSGRFASTAAYLSAFTSADDEGSAYLQQLSTNGLLSNADTGAIGGADVDGGAVLDQSDVLPDPSGYSYQPLDGFELVWPDGIDPDIDTADRTNLSFQVGANVGERIDVDLVRAGLQTLGLDDLDVAVSANKTIARVDKALEFVDSMRAELGAALSRMDSAIATDSAAAENTDAARSRIVDADYAVETAALTRASVIRDAGIAVLAQANSRPSLVLSLLAA